MRHTLILILIAALPGCTTFPDVDIALAADGDDATTPEIRPIGELLASIDAARLTPESGLTLAARAASLRSRARAINGQVLTNRERRKLRQAILRHRRER
ncbi:hypothetical protein ACMU_11505 [Actibacterium mucosum KCTC 23349]|uniref:Uncharacterized protein n=1 Tax=Actibacterium mucosum KCTC 23349 TaxID=1454373 RepID=A0A037ZIE1_9RHOB|nr:hypothetical protein [Actibacterium mucosum]KAJ55317.1 hypothetical protein ACMU_11505 [Actibacterium mucosum KCTC 23349]